MHACARSDSFFLILVENQNYQDLLFICRLRLLFSIAKDDLTRSIAGKENCKEWRYCHVFSLFLNLTVRVN